MNFYAQKRTGGADTGKWEFLYHETQNILGERLIGPSLGDLSVDQPSKKVGAEKQGNNSNKRLSKLT